MKNTLIALAAVITLSCTTSSDVDINDYPIITTVDDLARYYELNVDRTGQFENLSITKYFDGSMDLDYTYDLLESDVYDPLFYSITISKERTIKDAKETYVLEKGVTDFIGNSFAQGIIEVDSLSLPGDETFYGMRTYDGQLNGMFYIVRKGKFIYSMIISGMYTTDHSLLTDLILPEVARLEQFRIVE